LPVLMTFANADEDVALLKVDTTGTDAGTHQVMPIAPAQTASFLSTGQVAEMGGFGLTEAQAAGGLRFLVESIVGIDGSTIEVDGFGRSGACEGDSGGPLLARGPDGSAVVIGVLSMGPATCRDRDTYARVDTVASWISGVVGSVPGSGTECGGIGPQGRCFYGTAVWCAGGSLTAQSCGGDSECGWDPDTRGFRCVTAANDTCHGIDSVGTCRDSSAAWCSSGVLSTQPCHCSQCRIDGRTGQPFCG
jgi:hypothetical protein